MKETGPEGTFYEHALLTQTHIDVDTCTIATAVAVAGAGTKNDVCTCAN